jgi:hypothetical protein
MTACGLAFIAIVRIPAPALPERKQNNCATASTLFWRQQMQHSNIVGGSTAKRVINCPGSVVLVQKMPPKPSQHADRGTLLHNAISAILEGKNVDVIGSTYEGQVLTQDLYNEKITVALALLDEVDPFREMMYEVETRVGFGNLLPDVFGSTDLVGRIGTRAIVLDWKFGDGVVVDAVENEQLMFYAAAAMRTDAAKWAFDGATEIECIIIQPPMIKRWVTTKERIAQFERDLVRAVQAAQLPDANLATGDHCRWCAAKPVCPLMTGAVDRALQTQMQELDITMLSQYLKKAEMIESWIKDLRELAVQLLEKSLPVPGYKLVAKRGTRQWADEHIAKVAIEFAGLNPYKEPELLSPAQAEKMFKKSKLILPDELFVTVSSGTTLASEDDPRPAVLQLSGLTAALSKLQ